MVGKPNRRQWYSRLSLETVHRWQYFVKWMQKVQKVRCWTRANKSQSTQCSTCWLNLAWTSSGAERKRRFCMMLPSQVGPFSIDAVLWILSCRTKDRICESSHLCEENFSGTLSVLIWQKETWSQQKKNGWSSPLHITVSVSTWFALTEVSFAGTKPRCIEGEYWSSVCSDKNTWPNTGRKKRTVAIQGCLSLLCLRQVHSVKFVLIKKVQDHKKGWKHAKQWKVEKH